MYVCVCVYKALHIWIELSVAVKRMYVNNNYCDSYAYKIYFTAVGSLVAEG